MVYKLLDWFAVTSQHVRLSLGDTLCDVGVYGRFLPDFLLFAFTRKHSGTMGGIESATRSSIDVLLL